VTDRKTEANRRNARLSTGPRTGAGKAIVARNALRHGLGATSHAMMTGNLGLKLEYIALLRALKVHDDEIERALITEISTLNLRLTAIRRRVEVEIEAGRKKALADNPDFTELPLTHQLNRGLITAIDRLAPLEEYERRTMSKLRKLQNEWQKRARLAPAGKGAGKPWPGMGERSPEY
jgi:hypothetical protein